MTSIPALHVAQIAASAYLGYLAYILAMGIYRAHLTKRLSTLHRALLLPLVLVLIVLDVVANLTLASLCFFDLPREWLLTSRLKRYTAYPLLGWRNRVSTWICDNLLDPFDPKGDHC